MTTQANLNLFQYEEILNGDSITQQQFREVIDFLLGLTNIIEQSGAPTITAPKHAWYFDTATNRYYRNVDGAATWVALN